MVAINEDYNDSKAAPRLVRASVSGEKRFTLAFYSHANLPTPPTSFSVPKSPKSNTEESGDIKLSDFLDIPLLVSDNEEEETDGESISSGSKSTSTEFLRPMTASYSAAQEVKRSIKEEKAEEESATNTCPEQTESELPEVSASNGSELSTPAADSTDTFKQERSKVMKIIVKYVAMKIKNSFPPESARTHNPNEMPLDEFLMILVSRLQLTLPTFMKGIIYLFRYMDIIYLLRYLNQSNNFANYTDMGYGLKKLIIGCYRLVLARERVTKDWSGITGLSNAQINSVVKTVVGRLNGKLNIKSIELVRMRSEIFRFVKMVTKSV